MKNWILNSLVTLTLLFAVILFDGCWPNESISASESDIMITRKNDSINFKQFKTYYMPDEVVPIRDDSTDKTPIPEEGLILSTIASNLDNYGWVRLTETDTNQVPDAVVVSFAIATTNVSVGWWWPWVPGWGWGGWGWGWGWGWHHPGWMPPVPVVTSWTTGTILTEMLDPNDYIVVGQDTLVTVMWEGALHGVLNAGSVESRITRGIDQQFTQSPYLNLNADD